MIGIETSVEEAYVAVVRSLPQVSAIRLRAYKTPPEYEERLGGGERARWLAKEARRLRWQHGIPFWDGVLLSAVKRAFVDRTVVQGVAFHQIQSDETIRVDRHTLLEKGLPNTASQHLSWAVISAVEVENGGARHLPMMDFRCPVAADSLGNVVRISEKLVDHPFVILNTQRSYHLLGAVLLDFPEFVGFLGRANMFGPIVDRAYISHQLIEGCAALRISPDETDSTPTPCYSTLPSSAWSA